MWFLGAGCSVSAGVPTAGDMIWEFKRLLYCTEQRIPLSRYPDLGDSRARSVLQAFFDGKTAFPPVGADDEYAIYFEAARRTEADRRRYIHDAVAGARPPFGHTVLAALMAAGHCPIIWTTNFDRVIEDAAYTQFGTSMRLTVAGIDAPHIAQTAYSESRFPLLVKLHGDYQSTRLRNTGEELRDQDEKLRCLLEDSCTRFGLCVVGYSGRDLSIMDALESAFRSGQTGGSCLFWFHRSDSPPSHRTLKLMDIARSRGIDAHCIECETFDELMGDIAATTVKLPQDSRDRIAKMAPRISAAPVPATGGAWPVIRLNALPVLEAPTVCRLIDCKVGGTGEVRELVEKAGVDLIVGRRQCGVLLFGRNADALRVFERLGISRFDLHNIETRRLHYESAEHGLLYEAIVKAVCRVRPLLPRRRRGQWALSVDPIRSGDDILRPLKCAVKSICGNIGGAMWSEAVQLTLECRMDRLWLVFEPTVWLDCPGDALPADAREFRRNRATGRYNSTWNDLVNAWAKILTGNETIASLSTYDMADGIDAKFVISGVTGFSRRTA